MKKHEKILLFAALLCILLTAAVFSIPVGSAAVTLRAIGAPDGGRLNINTADAEALDILPGIGPALAESILNRRAELGAFSSRDALLSTAGIGEARLSAIEAYITY